MTEPTQARSALNLRLVLAAGGTLMSLVLTVPVWRAFGPAPALPLLVLAVAGAIDVVVVLRRKRQRAADHRGAGHRHDSLFE